MLERLRLVPKGHWTLARRGGFAFKIESEPRPGLRKSRDDHSVAHPGLAPDCVQTGGLQSPRRPNVRDASGVRYRCRPQVPAGKTQHICPRSYLYKTVSAEGAFSFLAWGKVFSAKGAASLSSLGQRPRI